MCNASGAYAITDVSHNFAQAVANFSHGLEITGVTVSRIPSGNISAAATPAYR